MSHAESLLFKIIARSALVVGLALGIVFIPNLSIFDEDLLPEIKAHLATLPSPEIEGNAAPMMLGMWATSDRDIKQVGEQAIAALRAKHTKGKTAHLSGEDNLRIYGVQDIQTLDKDWQELYPAIRCNPRERSDCFAQMLTELSTQPINNERLSIQLERYARIIQQPHFIEESRGMDTTSPIPNYGYILYLGRLASADSYKQRGLDGLIETSAADMKFWRMALKESQVLLGKMVAVNALRKDLDNLSYAIAKEPQISSAQLEKLQALVHPLQKNELNIDIFASEYRSMLEDKYFFDFIADTSSLHNRLLLLLSQHYAAINWFYKQSIVPAQKLSQMSSPDFYIAAQNRAQSLPFSRINPYNLGGKIIFSNNWQMTDYIGRIRDLDGLYLLLNMQIELRKTTADIAETIKLSRFKNPYTEKPFDYDSDRKTLGFTCFDVRDVCKIAL